MQKLRSANFFPGTTNLGYMQIISSPLEKKKEIYQQLLSDSTTKYLCASVLTVFQSTDTDYGI